MGELARCDQGGALAGAETPPPAAVDDAVSRSYIAIVGLRSRQEVGMPSESDNIQGLDAVREALVSAFLRRDYTALATLFAANATLMPPGTRIIKNCDTIRDFWASVGEHGNEIALEPLEITPLGGDAVREIGRMRMTIGDQSPQIVLNKYLLLWQRADDSWLVESLIWNRIRPVQGRNRLLQNREQGQTGRPQIPQLYSG